MDSIDYYKTLGLTKKASKAEIKAAYRKLARKYHPDKNPENKDAELSFQKINEANNVLSDPVKRKKYDQYGKDWQHADEFVNSRQQSSSNSRYSQGRSGSSSGDDFSEFFGSMFGGAGNNRNRQQVKFKGEDYSSELHVTLIDAYTTHQQTLNVNGKAIRITVPAGIKNGQTIKIKGHGGPGINGGPKGDLYLSFHSRSRSI
jgi:curved DNA-binding protein